MNNPPPIRRPGMENKIAIPLLCLAAVAYACGPWRNSSGIAAPANVVAQSAKSSEAIATLFDVIPGVNGVDFTLSIANNTKEAVELRFPTSQTHDFKVLNSKGETIWQWSQGRMFTQAMQSKVVKSHDTLTIANDWDAKNAKGEYVAVAILNTDTQPIIKRAVFRIP